MSKSPTNPHVASATYILINHPIRNMFKISIEIQDIFSMYCARLLPQSFKVYKTSQQKWTYIVSRRKYHHCSLVNPKQNIPRKTVYYASWPAHKEYAVEHAQSDQQHKHNDMLVPLSKIKQESD